MAAVVRAGYQDINHILLECNDHDITRSNFCTILRARKPEKEDIRVVLGKRDPYVQHLVSLTSTKPRVVQFSKVNIRH